VHKLITTVSTFAIANVMTVAGAQAALAHDVHPFGKVTVALGWLHEPAYVGFDNAVQVLVKDPSGKPITDISDKDLMVEVGLGSQKMAKQPLLPTADPDTGLGIPGEYEMHFIPTAPGNYTFHLHGTVTGQAIDETVTASDKTFGEVKSDDEVEFPNKVPAAADLAAKLDRISSRLDSARNSADRAFYVAIAAIILAVLLGIADILLVRRRT